jgi:hypothetical protein
MTARERLPRPHRRRSYRRRRGYALVLFAMLFFALLTLAALVIDLGIARLAQRQVQTAADTAALEALRGRDRDRAQADLGRRSDAQTVVRQVFDDDLDPGSGDADGLGAGPIFELTGGIALSPEFAASQQLALPATPVYDPLLALNLGNDPLGDMVAGRFADDAPPDKQPSYARQDFAAGQGDDAFLVRLRRTDEPSVEGVRSSGGPIPYLFGRGSLLNVDLRGRGIAVRATAIADARPAMSVGKRPESPPEVEAQEIPGALALVLPADVWGNSDVRVERQADGSLTARGRPVLATNIDPADGLGIGLSVGSSFPVFPQVPEDFFSDLVAAAAVYEQQPFGFVGLYAEFGSDDLPCIVGFGAAELTLDGARLTLTPRANLVAWSSASAALSRAMEPRFRDPVSGPQLAEQLWSIRRSVEAPLLAPALVR